MVLVVESSNVNQVKECLAAVGEPAYEIGHVVDRAANGGNHVKMVDMETKW